MKKNYGRILSRNVKKGLKIVSISALSSLVAFCSPQALCHVSAAGPVRFTTYLMIEENGEFARDSHGEYIQLFDEKGNLLAYNDDVKEFLESHAGEDGKNKLGAKAKEFFLINGKLYLDDSGSSQLTDLSEVMPAMFKYGDIDSGYTLQADNGTVYISPLNIDGDAVYIARVAGDYEKLPAFTISQDGYIGYLERGTVSDGENEASFVYDSNNFYDEDMNRLDNMAVLVPSEGDGNSPMFTGYYVRSGGDRRQFIDIDGSIVMSAADYMEMAGRAEAEYCYRVFLSAEGAGDVTLYSDTSDGTLYDDFRKNEGFDGLGGDVLGELSYGSNPARGHFAGFYGAGDEEGSSVRFIDAGGNLTDGSRGSTDGNRNYNARFYHILKAYGSDSNSYVYFEDGRAYSDPELQNAISNIKDVTGSIPEDSEEKVHSDKKDMDGVVKKYFLGYYFASDFGSTDGEGDSDEEVLKSEFDKEGFDPSSVDINKVKFADRDGNIVFDAGSAPDIDEDMGLYQNWYTVTVWDDGEVEVEEKADEVKEKIEPEDTEATEGEAAEKEAEGEGTEEGDESGEKKDEGDSAEDKSKEEGTEDKSKDEGTEDKSKDEGAGQDAEDKDKEENPDASDNKEGIEENAKPNDEDKIVHASSDEEGGNGDGDGAQDNGESQSSGGSEESGNASPDVVADIPKADDDKDQ